LKHDTLIDIQIWKLLLVCNAFNVQDGNPATEKSVIILNDSLPGYVLCS